VSILGKHIPPVCFFSAIAALFAAMPITAQLVDNHFANTSVGINKTYADEIGAGRGDIYTPNSSLYIIARDPFRAIRRGRQIFQRKFTREQGQGPVTGDGDGTIATTLAVGAGLSDSCAGCHGRPRGSGGSGGDVVTRPDSRDAPHLFGLGLKEMLADEMTGELRAIRANAIAQAKASGHSVTAQLIGKGVHFGTITASRNGSVDTAGVQGVDSDLRVRPFFAHGSTISIREFVVGAFNAEMGMQSVDPDLTIAHNGGRVITPSGMVLDGSLDNVEAPPTTGMKDDADGDKVTNEVPCSIVDFMEFYLLNYFKPGTYEQTPRVDFGRHLFEQANCTSCHIPDFQINRDRRVADVETAFDPDRGIFNNLFATATPLLSPFVLPAMLDVKTPNFQPFLVKNIFTDFKRHNLGPNFWERNYDGTIRKEFLTTPLWGVGTSAPYGHDGRSINLEQVILRHGGEAQDARDAFANMSDANREALIVFLNTLVLFPPDDTASNLDPGNRAAPNFPQAGHGSIRLTTLFANPNEPE